MSPLYTLGPRDTKMCKTWLFSSQLRVRGRALTSQVERGVTSFLTSFLHMEEPELGLTMPRSLYCDDHMQSLVQNSLNIQ